MKAKSMSCIALLIMVVGLNACNTVVKGTIMFPANGARLQNPIRLESSAPGEWFANGKQIGVGQSWSGDLTPGMYSISLGEPTADSTYISIRVLEDFQINRVRHVSPLNGELTLPKGRFAILWGNTNKIPISSSLPKSPTINPQQYTDQISDIQSRSQAFAERLEKQSSTLLKEQMKPAGRNDGTFRIQEVNQPIVGSRREFKMLNLEGVGSSLVMAQLLQVNSHSLVYIEEDPMLGEATEIGVKRTAFAFEDHIYDRDTKYFGASADVDHNNKVILFFSPRLNASKVAVGFFSPSDMLANSEQNPDSNEAEILYMGVPQADDPNFSQDSINATTCHEYQHLINFSNKTLPYAGGPNAPIEDLAVNEGLSHLAEDLCGYNRLGGNVVFAARYLSKPEAISLDGNDLRGHGDTVERRGAMYLFLRSLVDQYGTTFLRKAIQTPDTGLDNIAETIGVPLETLIWRSWWTAWMKPGSRIGGLQGFTLPFRDVYTGDQGGINTYAGEVFLPPSLTVRLDGPKSVVEWPEKLPARGVAYRTFVGPGKLSVPRSGSINVFRVQ
jgi:hypothetical protein